VTDLVSSTILTILTN